MQLRGNLALILWQPRFPSSDLTLCPEHIDLGILTIEPRARNLASIESALDLFICTLRGCDADCVTYGWQKLVPQCLLKLFSVFDDLVHNPLWAGQVAALALELDDGADTGAILQNEI